MNRNTFARWVSIVGHPFTFIVLLLLLPFWLRGDTRALRVAAIVVMAGLVPLWLFMRHRYTSGRWQTIDASARADRPSLYLAAFAVLVPLGVYFLVVEKSSALVRGSAILAIMFGVAAFLNRWIKLSGHLAFAGFAALILGKIRLSYGLPVGLFIPLLAWSRLALLRHTLPEVVGGLVLGLIAAAITIWW